MSSVLKMARDDTRAHAAMMSVREVAEFCSVSTDAVRRAIQRGDLPAAKIFSQIRVARSDLDAYVERSRVGGSEVAHRRPPTRRKPPPPGGLREALTRQGRFP